MNAVSPLRASACPSLYRLAPARDGHIARIKLPLGHLSRAAARAIADAAGRFGNGIIEITSRANLQVRGLKQADGPAFAALLHAAGLGADPAAEDVLNVFVAPTHGRDGLLDTGPLARRLLQLLRDTPSYHQLSPKFSIGIDGGEAAMPRAHPHDIWLRAVDAENFAVGLCSSPLAEPIGAVKAENAEAWIADLLDQMAASGCGRMRELQHPDLLGLIAVPDRPPASSGSAPLGSIGSDMVGGRPALGRLDPDMLLALADLDGELRLTPWQSVLLVGVSNAEMARQQLQGLGLVTDPDAPLARIVACSGSGGCRSGRADTQADALTLAARLDEATDIHLSGCEKSCAAARALPVTLIAVAPGHYDLYRRDKKQGRNRFGRRVGAGLGIDAIADLLASGA